MKTKLAWLFVFLLPTLGFSTDLKGHWALEKSEITYTVTHPLHVVQGKSLSARGKGVCYSGHCEFLVEVLVKSFDSGDSNRDLHMLQVTKAGLYPLVKVNAVVTEKIGKEAPRQLLTDLKVQFAGKTVNYPKVKLDVLEWKPDGVHLTGTIPLTLKEFEIDPPALLTIPVKNEVPVKLDVFWKRAEAREVKKK